MKSDKEGIHRPDQESSLESSFEIRRATARDAQAISALIESLSHYRSPKAGGVAPEEFSAGYAAARIEEHILGGSVSYFVAIASDTLVGVIGIGDGPRVRHFFVAERLHRQGLGHALWERAKADVLGDMAAGTEKVIEVRSSIHAVPVYERFGFNVCGAAVEDVGVTYLPMRAILTKAGN